MSSGQAFAAACAATMASDSGRRPKGVVEDVFHGRACHQAKIRARRNGAETLDSDSRKCDSLERQLLREGFRNGTVLGAFSFAGLLLSC